MRAHRTILQWQRNSVSAGASLISADTNYGTYHICKAFEGDLWTLHLNGQQIGCGDALVSEAIDRAERHGGALYSTHRHTYERKAA